MKVIGTMKHEQITNTLMGVCYDSICYVRRGMVVLDLLQCVTRGGWVVNMAKFWCYIIIEWPHGIYLISVFTLPQRKIITFRNIFSREMMISLFMALIFCMR